MCVFIVINICFFINHYYSNRAPPVPEPDYMTPVVQFNDFDKESYVSTNHYYSSLILFNGYKCTLNYYVV